MNRRDKRLRSKRYGFGRNTLESFGKGFGLSTTAMPFRRRHEPLLAR
jgi:hypothetical protein